LVHLEERGDDGASGGGGDVGDVARRPSSYMRLRQP
jgi:hypothetical protein